MPLSLSLGAIMNGHPAQSVLRSVVCAPAWIDRGFGPGGTGGCGGRHSVALGSRVQRPTRQAATVDLVPHADWRVVPGTATDLGEAATDAESAGYPQVASVIRVHADTGARTGSVLSAVVIPGGSGFAAVELQDLDPVELPSDRREQQRQAADQGVALTLEQVTFHCTQAWVVRARVRCRQSGVLVRPRRSAHGGYRRPSRCGRAARRCGTTTVILISRGAAAARPGAPAGRIPWTDPQGCEGVCCRAHRSGVSVGCGRRSRACGRR
jgi:hypothetical protein